MAKYTNSSTTCHESVLRANEIATANAVMPTYIGEWSAVTNICINSDGTTTADASCSTSGCQCQSTDFSQWNEVTIEQVRRYVEAQLDTFERSASGYFNGVLRDLGGFLNGIANGAIPNPVTERRFLGQCGGKRRVRRDGLGGMGWEVKGRSFEAGMEGQILFWSIRHRRLSWCSEGSTE